MILCCLFSVSEFRWCFILCLLDFKFGLGCCVTTFLEIAVHSVGDLFSFYYVCLCFWLFPILVLRAGLTFWLLPVHCFLITFTNFYNNFDLRILYALKTTLDADCCILLSSKKKKTFFRKIFVLVQSSNGMFKVVHPLHFILSSSGRGGSVGSDATSERGSTGINPCVRYILW